MGLGVRDGSQLGASGPQQSRSPKLCTYDNSSLEARNSHTALCSQAPAILQVRPLASSRSTLL